ncbi:CO(2)-response secreted protease, partial [Striga hermonthica]
MEECRGVVSVFPDSSLELHTTRSWEFLRSQDAFRIINKKATTTTTTTTISPPYASNFLSGDHDTIIGMIDTGIWPEASSFMPTQRMRQTPTRWKGKCLGGKNFSCNWKVIGARFYDDPLHPGRVTSARDMYGHGMLTSSIAAGMPVSGASYYGLAKGTAIGGSPNSRIAMYCIAGADYTTLSAILKSIDDAIHDGVDVISIPYRYPENVDFLANPVYIAAFHAAARGVTVVGSAGNQGPDPESVTNNAPWILSVGATTIDRDLEADILFDEKTSIKGGGINFCRLSKSYPLIDAVRAATNPRDPYNASHCFPGSLDPKKVKGKLLLCENDDNNYETTEKFESLKKLGVIGMIAISGYERQEQLFYGTNPIAAVTERDGSWIRTYINSKRKTLAKILPTTTILNYTPAPVVAEFSSRGPPPGIQNLIKPDVVAPGVGILAAYPPFDYYKISGMDPPDFIILWGTSLSCAHAVGLAALIKSQHPTWSSSAIISAIMTT